MTNTLRKISIFILLCLFIATAAKSQSLKAYIKAADQAYLTHDYFSALVYYKKILEVEPQRTDVHFRYAEAAREFQAYRIAEDAYHQITTGRDSLRYPQAMYWLGVVKKGLGKYGEAENTFEKYLSRFKRGNVRLARKAEKHITDCQWAARAVQSNSSNIQVSPIEGDINTPYSEFGATEIDGEIYFSSMKFMNKLKLMNSTPMRNLLLILP